MFFVCSLHIIFSSQSVCRFVYESVIPKIKSKKSAVRPSVNSKWIAVSCGFIIFIWIPSINFIVASKTFYYADFAIRHFVRLCHAFAVIDLFATIVPRSDAFCQVDSNVSFLTILYLFSLYFIGFITAFLHNSSVSVTIRFLKKSRGIQNRIPRLVCMFLNQYSTLTALPLWNESVIAYVTIVAFVPSYTVNSGLRSFWMQSMKSTISSR